MERDPAKQGRSTCRTFTVTEISKQRRRWITHTPTTNEIEEIGDCVLSPAPVGRGHAFEGTTYSLKTIPTGANFCPALAQLFFSGLNNAVRAKYPLVETDVYTDNTRITAQDRAYRELDSKVESLIRKSELVRTELHSV